jgi:hypothetical protein
MIVAEGLPRPVPELARERDGRGGLRFRFLSWL